MTKRAPAILVLEDGRVFHGEAYGAVGETLGEAVFSTGMTGYQETLTDPSYHRQIVAMTSPHIGNTGVNDEDDESARVWVAGFVVRQPSRIASNWRAKRSLEDELATQGVVGICGVDTRALTRHLRERGSMRAGISSVDTNPQRLLAKVLASPPMAGANLIADVTTREPYTVAAASGDPVLTVAAIDYGIKRNTPRRMAERGIETRVLPASSTVDEVLAQKPDAVFLSNGPGDPATADLSLIKGLLESGTPIFGICFGNQLLGRALGLDTFKLRYGHRGINQPVLDKATGKVEVTAHNHGFAVKAPAAPSVETPYGTAEVSHVCLNDDVVEGLRLTRDGKTIAFSVQYHPEAAAGPHDADYLFDRLVTLAEGAR
ncbi:carbamoyl-phosphate synthase small chain [Actinorhabdospora filicis]|uniref:Carbamoyl phosphate synthase small chain n=1 Tax=Actinorhabdospora filicis TaxID=1785913 RepID=A0A9W6W673_9ACTN|nr:glutamine-hydrolyzing carbamoyl-phosphate synthase small subunit [Actinorhabdospora filicis]GLZ75274.1 carbamoyl-phosphate synthase small chain [Actinorhabdospora filicis]